MLSDSVVSEVTYSRRLWLGVRHGRRSLGVEVVSHLTRPILQGLAMWQWHRSVNINPKCYCYKGSMRFKGTLEIN